MSSDAQNRSAYFKPFISQADDSLDGSGNVKEPSKRTCLVIEKDSCKIYSRGKSAKHDAQNIPFLSKHCLPHASSIFVWFFTLIIEPTIEEKQKRNFDCVGVLGIVNIMGCNFLVTVKSKGGSHVARVRNNIKVHEIREINLTPFKNLAFEADQRLSLLVDQFVKLFNGPENQGTGFYFSYHADLSISH